MVINDEEENNFISYGLAVRFRKSLEHNSNYFRYFFFKIIFFVNFEKNSKNEKNEKKMFSRKRGHGLGFLIKMRNLNGHGLMGLICHIPNGIVVSLITGKLLPE